MEKRRYTKIQVLEAEIVSVQAAGIPPKPKDRPHKEGQRPHQSEAAELKRLRMENQLLRIMKKYEVLAEIRGARQWRIIGQQVYKYKNLLIVNTLEREQGNGLPARNCGNPGGTDRLCGRNR